MLRIFIAIILERTGHGTQGKHFFVLLLVTQHEHTFLIVIPVAGHFIQVALRHQRRLRSHIAPLFVLQILDPALQLHHHLRASWQKQRQSLPDHIHCSEKLHLTPQLVVIPALDVLQMFQMRLQLLFFLKYRAIDTLQLRLIGIATPVCHRGRDQLVGLDILRAHQMRAGTQIHEAALVIERNLRVLRQILDQFHLVRLSLFFHKFDCFRSGQGKPLDPVAFLDDLLHLRFQLIQILPGKRSRIKVIVKSVLDGRPDRHLGLREKPFYRLRQNMRCGMPKHFKPLRIAGCQDIQAAVFVDHGPQILHDTVHLTGTGRSGQPFRNIMGDIINAHCLCVLFTGSVF